MGCANSASRSGGDDAHRGAIASSVAVQLPLRGEPWSTPSPVSRAQVLRRRDEFWDTSPSYEGRAEIWQALRLACDSEDDELAYAIIDSANIRLPQGTLEHAYDELGNLYRIPDYCRSFPTNMRSDEEVAASRPLPSFAAIKAAEGSLPTGQAPRGEGTMALRVRLSTGTTTTIKVEPSYTIGEVKVLLQQQQASTTATAAKMTAFFCGKCLQNATTLKDAGWSQEDILQMFVV